MVFIIDSGSTKSDWVLLDKKNDQRFFSTMGFNPYFHDEQNIVEAILDNEKIKECANQINSVYFYGAGCSNPELNLIIENAFKIVFTQADIFVNHDLTACAYATYNGKPAISCIIGTGSNSCFFDGENISEVVPALGYILGDEGSGTYFGKQLLSSFLYNQLPKNIENDFIQEFELDKAKIVENVYKKPNANVYLASFMKFISKHSEEDFFKNMIYQGMKKFIEIHVCCFKNHRKVEVHFVGSLAFIFKIELEKAAKEMNISIGQILQKPIEGLVNYHLKYIL